MKIVLTEAQACFVIQALEWAKNPDFPQNDSYNMMFQRIIDKIKKAREE